jgi:hypothetical protein
MKVKRKVTKMPLTPSGYGVFLELNLGSSPERGIEVSVEKIWRRGHRYSLLAIEMEFSEEVARQLHYHFGKALEELDRRKKGI